MFREQNESYVHWLKRVIQAVREKKIDYDEMGNCLLGEDNVYCHDNLRKMFYALDVIADKLDEDIVTTDKELIKQIQNEKDELFKETVKLRDKKREIRNDLRKMARFENLEQVLVDKLAESPKPIPKSQIQYEFEKNLEASLLISDIHYGIKVNNAVNQYDTDISYKRLTDLINKTIRYCQLHKVQVLNVELLGDLISGCINVSNRVEQEEDLIVQIIEISSILSNLINKLTEYIPTVNVYCVFGNHSRVNPNKKENVNRENYERLIFKYIELKTNVNNFITSENEDYLTYNLLSGRTILCTHGDKDNKISLVNNYNNVLGFTPDEIHIGHWHSFEDKDDNLNNIIINGSVVGTDDYALSMRKNTPPCQALRIYGEDICTYKIRL